MPPSRTVTVIQAGATPAGSAPTISQHPTDRTVNAGAANTRFSVTASGNPSPTYQWWWRPPSGTWIIIQDGNFNLTGSTTNTLTVVESLSHLNGYQFRCVVSNVHGSVTSNPATLTVNATFTISASPVAVNFSGAQGYLPEILVITNNGTGLIQINPLPASHFFNLSEVFGGGSSSIDPGSTYKFSIRPKNMSWPKGAYSDPIVITTTTPSVTATILAVLHIL